MLGDFVYFLRFQMVCCSCISIEAGVFPAKEWTVAATIAEAIHLYFRSNCIADRDATRVIWCWAKQRQSCLQGYDSLSIILTVVR